MSKSNEEIKNMKFYGNGVCWDAQKKKPLCSFKDGIYETEDAREISILIEAGYKYDGELQIKYDSSKKEINELKSKVIELEKKSNPKEINELSLKIESLENNNKQLKEIISENERAKELLIDKAIELKFAKKKEIESWTLIELCEQFLSRLEGVKDGE